MPTQSQSRESSQERDAAPEEVAILRLISEQGAMTTGHLAGFFDLYRSDMERFIAELVDEGWVKTKQFVTAEDVWVWLTHRGCVLSGTGYGMTPVFPRKLPHWHAMNEARLFLARQEPEGVWVCERELRRRNRRKRSHRDKFVPDAVFVISNEKGEVEHHAIEIELSRKDRAYLRKIIAHHSARYDAVVYLCSRKVLRYMKGMALTNKYPTLIVRELTEDVRLLRQEKFRVDSKAGVDSKSALQDADDSAGEPWERAVLCLISEQGAIPLDQLARFLECDEAGVDRVVSHLLELRYIRRARPFPDESDWVWLTKRGVTFSGTDYSAADPALGGLARLRAVNEIRLLFKERVPEAQWISSRFLRLTLGNRAPRPAAVVEVNGERRAIEVRLRPMPDHHLGPMLDRRSEDYDGVTLFCAGPLYNGLKRLEKSGRWPKLAITPLPRSKKSRSSRRSDAVKVVMAKIPPEDLPHEVQLALFAEHPHGAEAKIKSVARCVRPVRSRRFRIETEDGIWRVAKSRQGWRATRYEERLRAFEPREIVLEIGESLPESAKQSRDRSSEVVMAKIPPEDLPDAARSAFLTACDGRKKPKLVSLERRIRPTGSQQYRLVASDGLWRVGSCRTGWYVQRYENVEDAYEADEIRLEPGEQYVPPDFLNERQRSFVSEAIEATSLRCSMKGYMERFGIARGAASRDLAELVKLRLMSRQAVSGSGALFMPTPNVGRRLKELDAQHQRLREAQAQRSASKGGP